MRPVLQILLPLVAALHMTAAPAAGDADLQQWMDGPQRSERNRQRDQARKPAETLAFFGLKADQTVVEIWPSVGVWWFEILAPYLRDKGRYIAALHAGAHNPAAGRAEHEVVEGLIAKAPIPCVRPQPVRPDPPRTSAPHPEPKHRPAGP